MITGTPVEEIVKRFGKGSTNRAKLHKMLDAYDVKTVNANRNFELPNENSLMYLLKLQQRGATGLLRMRRKHRKGWHCVALINGVIHDPECKEPGQFHTTRDHVASFLEVVE